MSIAVLGAGAFGTALAISLARDGRAVRLWARDADHCAAMARDRQNGARLDGFAFPDSLQVVSDLSLVADADTILLAIPTQKLGGFLQQSGDLLDGKALVACCKGIDLSTGQGPTTTIQTHSRNAKAAILSGPSFARDIAAGLPTALTLAAKTSAQATSLQSQLSTANLRLYRSTDITGVELGGALKNVIAIACGACIGQGMGESARASLMTRGFAEMQRLAVHLGAQPETLAGLSGFGDLALTCSSDMSRNYRFGLALGRQEEFDASVTVEGAATAQAALALGQQHGLDLPITQAVTRIAARECSVADAIADLFRRPLRAE